jgi:hypothetical protein
VFTATDLLDRLDSGDQACNPPTDIFESITVVDADGEHRAGVTFCSFPDIDAARAMANELVEKYLP